MKKLFFTFLFYFIAATAVAQYCSCITSIKDENEETETKSGTTKSNDAYSLLFQKEKQYSNLSKAPVFYISLTAASRSLLSSTLTNNKVKIELQLKDKSKIVLEKAKSIYNPVAMGFSVTFGTLITKEQLESILLNPIVSFNVLGVLKTTFKDKSQREQQIIVNCLLSEDW